MLIAQVPVMERGRESGGRAGPRWLRVEHAGSEYPLTPELAVDLSQWRLSRASTHVRRRRRQRRRRRRPRSFLFSLLFLRGLPTRCGTGAYTPSSTPPTIPTLRPGRAHLLQRAGQHRHLQARNLTSPSTMVAHDRRLSLEYVPWT
jgi:hypothetical protein